MKLKTERGRKILKIMNEISDTVCSGRGTTPPAFGGKLFCFYGERELGASCFFYKSSEL
jgi:hypothetical protein